MAIDEPVVQLFRSMKAGSDNLPSVGPTARELGARPEYDIPIDEEGNVRPLSGGISVSPVAAERLPEHRRPPELGGRGPDPVWNLSSARLPASLRYRADEEDPDKHGTIEPREVMTFEAYQNALAETRSAWTLVEKL